jgi:hypothetical protein
MAAATRCIREGRRNATRIALLLPRDPRRGGPGFWLLASGFWLLLLLGSGLRAAAAAVAPGPRPQLGCGLRLRR